MNLTNICRSKKRPPPDDVFERDLLIFEVSSGIESLNPTQKLFRQKDVIFHITQEIITS